MGHGAHTIVGDYASLVIVSTYIAFVLQLGLQLAMHLRHGDKLRKGAGALLSLMVVFVFCALSGYVSDYFIPDCPGGEMNADGTLPAWMLVRETLHVVLAAAGAALVATNAGGAVARMLAAHPDGPMSHA